MNKFFLTLIILGCVLSATTNFAMEAPNEESETPFSSFNFIHLDKQLENACRHAESAALQRSKMHGEMGFHTVQYFFVMQLNKQRARIFNWSLAKILVDDEEMYLIAARIIASQKDIPILPGNGRQSRFEKGENFWWINWKNSDFLGGTLFFLADKDFKEFSLVPPTLPVNEEAMFFLVGQDTRLTKIGEKVYAYNPKVNNTQTSFAHEVRIVDGEFELINPIKSPQSGGNNWGVTHIDDSGFTYLDWFYKEGVKIKTLTNQTTREFLLPYRDDDYPILGDPNSNDAGKNTGIMPYFSFGSSHVEVEPGLFLGVGHLKIDTDLQSTYKAGSAISTFRDELYRDFKSKYGARYRRHDAISGTQNKGFNYLLFFYTIKFGDHGHEMRISDAFLPVKLDHKLDDGHDYKFSLIFPMGVTQRGDKLLVSCGYGDYYSVLLEFEMTEAISVCRHDISLLNLENFSYHIVASDEKGKTLTQPSLRALLSNTNFSKQCDLPGCEKQATLLCPACKVASYCNRKHKVKHKKLEHQKACNSTI